MRRLLVVAVLLLTLLALLSGSAFATDWFVAPTPTGNDGNAGTIGAPFATLQHALTAAQPGDIVQMRAGVYPDGVWLERKAGTPAAYITVRSYDGDLAANQDAGVLLPAGSYISFQGIDFSTANHQCVQIGGIWTGEGYDKPHHVEFKRCRFHERDTDGIGGQDELVKCSQAEYLTLEDCEIYVDNGTYTQTSMPIDWVWVSYSTARRVYIHDFNYAGFYTKGGSQYDVLEQSVISQCRNYGPAVETGGGTGLDYCNPNTEYESEYLVVRNNILRQTSYAGIKVECVRWFWIYNNLIADVGDSRAFGYGYRPYVRRHDAEDPIGNHQCGHSESIRVFNNIFLDTAGDMGSAYGYDDCGTSTDWVNANNNYYNNGNAIPAGDLTVDGQLKDPNTETGATLGSPDLTSPTGSATTRQGWIDLYRPLWNSQSNAMLKDKGSSTAGAAPRPGVITDIEGNVRPRDAGWDIGPYEYQGAVAAPTADFAADNTVGVAPATIAFTDYSSGGPTTWAWTFGDGGTSSAQNPTHVYSAYGTYPVSLTATNSAGSDGETKTGYIVIKPLQADFSGTPIWGAAPLAVTFTDLSTNSPTAWSWTFGDAGTSTAQNPSHTYNSMGNYTVVLTATNSNGSDTKTKTDYLQVCTAYTYAPTDWRTNAANTPEHRLKSCDSGTGIWPLAGSVSDLAALGGGYMEFPPAIVGFFADTPFTPDQIRAVRFEATARSTCATNPNGGWYVYRFSDQNCAPGDAWTLDWALFPWGNQWVTHAKTFDLAVFPGMVGANGELMCDFWPSNAPGEPAYTLQFDYAKFTVWVKPTGGSAPVANFSGNPTSGAAPLAVSFTDASSNTPTSWSWTFGDSNTSTAQNPSHTYNAVGTYTVALTATNAYGSNTNTKAGYIAVSAGTVFYPVAETRFWGATEVSGTLANLQADDNVYKTWASDTGANGYVLMVQHDFHTGYTSSQVSRITIEYRMKSNRNDTPNMLLKCYSTDGATGVLWSSLNTTEQLVTWTTTNIAYYFPSDGNTYFQFCCCPQVSGQVYQASADQMKLTLELVGGSAPVANFSGTPTSGAAPLAVTFTDTSTNTPTSWSWAFGDSNTSTAQNPSHTYAAGTYTVTLTATNASGSDGETKTNYITAGNAPVANFSGTPTSGAAPLAVTFTDSSTNSPTAWSWTFGDSTTSTAQNPSHTYASVGTYTVALKATNAYGNNTNTKTNYIAATVPPPVANFTANVTLGIAPLAVTFTDSSTNTPTSWSWNFGDSTTSTAQNPSHTYNAVGNYTVALTATNAGGNSTNTKTNFIAVCTEVTVYPNDLWMQTWINATITGGSLADVRTDNGIYHVSTPNAGNQDARRYKFTVAYAPTNLAKMTLECQFKSSRADVPLHGMAIRHLDDNTFESVLAQQLWGTADRDIPAFSRTAVSEYVLADGQVWADICGCPSGNLNAYTTSVDFMRLKLWVKPGTTISAPTANFTGTPATGAAPLAVTFTDSSTGTPTFWAWEFGDGTSSTVQSPSHSYAANGTYSVTLTVNNGYGSNTLTRSNYITVATPSAPTFVAAGAVASGTGTIAPALPTGRATNDILLLFVETANQASSITNQNGGTWTQVTNSPQSTGTAGATTATRLTVFWSRNNGTQGAPTVSDSGDHQVGRIIAIRGATTSGDPCNITAGGVEATADTSGAIPGATTTVANTLVVAAIATSLPDASSTAKFSGWANADLTGVTERTDNTVTAGNGGGLALATGVKATAGAYTTTSVTLVNASTKAMMSIAIKP